MLLLLLGVAQPGASSFLMAGSSSSAHYSILTDAVDSGGGPAGGANYQHIGSAGLIAGLSTAAPSLALNHGYIAQLDLASVQVLSAVSRKTHGAVGAFDINLPLTQSAGVECRAGQGTGGDHQMIVTFANPVTFSGASVTSGTGSVVGTPTVAGGIVTINLTGVTNAQTIKVTLSNVSDGVSTGNVIVPMSVLMGDTNGNGSVNSSDVSQTKGQTGQALTASNFREDVIPNGSLNSSDVAAAKSKTGTALP